MTPAGKKLVGILGIVLVLGGLAHCLGVTHLYVTRGLPDLNRILLDVWIGEAQIVGGVLFLIGARKTNPLPWILGGALMVWTWTISFLPVLVHRAKPIFSVMPTLYSVTGVVAVRWAGRQAARS